MRIVFADTGYWVALLNPHDDLHDNGDESFQSSASRSHSH